MISYSDVYEQLDPNNLITSVSDHNIHDGQKRYKTLGTTTSSNYPKPKTMFYVLFNCKAPLTELSDELSKYLIEVKKPNVTVNTSKMNQYNRIKYVIDNVVYGDLQLTFMDTKDSNVVRAFFSYLKNIAQDFNNTDNEFKSKYSVSSYTSEKWGLTTSSNDKKIESITIAEMYMDKITVYTVENPTISSVDFGSNKIGEYSPNNITVSFKVEGITNEMIISGKSVKDVIDDNIIELGGSQLAHTLQKRWGGGSYPIKDRTNDTFRNYYNEVINNQIYDTYGKLGKVYEENEYERAIAHILDYLSYPNKGEYFWVTGSGNTSYGLRTPRDRTFFMSGITDITDIFSF